MAGRTDRDIISSGGCLCGAVRYRFSRPEYTVHCHCRMCQRASGAPFATWIDVADGDFAITSGTPAFYRSSDIARRGFCGQCGSQMFMKYEGRDEIAVAAGSLDDPERVRPSRSIWTSERLSWVDCVDRGLRQYPEDED